ncbi:MAG: hypothetical protein GY948_19285 [Alphaproteobacteria bacterium]|nr:hypothetical protein [Alphaproteobacteria bacterium]
MKKLALVLGLISAALMVSPAYSQSAKPLPAGEYVTKAGLAQLFPGTFMARFKKYKVRFTASRNGKITGKYRLFSDKGSWWLRDRKLCIKLSSWFKGKTKCSYVIKYGPVYVAKDVVFSKL